MHFCNPFMKKQRYNAELLSSIAQQLKILREQKGISQADFYMDTDIHIGRIETGKDNLSISTLQTICAYFGISLQEFFRQIEERQNCPIK